MTNEAQIDGGRKEFFKSYKKHVKNAQYDEDWLNDFCDEIFANKEAENRSLKQELEEQKAYSNNILTIENGELLKLRELVNSAIVNHLIMKPCSENNWCEVSEQWLKEASEVLG